VGSWMVLEMGEIWVEMLRDSPPRSNRFCVGCLPVGFPVEPYYAATDRRRLASPGLVGRVMLLECNRWPRH
jgi:hypothetical protein